jgi:hypothetical protein
MVAIMLVMLSLGCRECCAELSRAATASSLRHSKDFIFAQQMSIEELIAASASWSFNI